MIKKLVCLLGLCSLLFLVACQSGVEETAENQQTGSGTGGNTYNAAPAPGQQGAPPPASDAPPPVKGRR